MPPVAFLTQIQSMTTGDGKEPSLLLGGESLYCRLLPQARGPPATHNLILLLGKTISIL